MGIAISAVAGGLFPVLLLLAQASSVPATGGSPARPPEASSVPAAQDASYVQVIVNETPIRAARGGGEVIGYAQRGTVLQLVGEQGDDYAVRLFSPRPRYVRRAAARPVHYRPLAPDDVPLRQQVLSALVAAEARAKQDQPSRGGRRADRGELLIDRYKFYVMRGYNLNPPVEPLLEEPRRTGQQLLP